MEYNFVEVVKQFDRMCQKYSNCCSLKECPIRALIGYWESCNGKAWSNECFDFARKYPYTFADVVMSWKEEEEEKEKLIYPTIGNIINKICMLMDIDPKTSINTIYDERLTKDAADYFGIEPINKGKLI